MPYVFSNFVVCDKTGNNETKEFHITRARNDIRDHVCHTLLPEEWASKIPVEKAVIMFENQQNRKYLTDE